MSSSPESRTAVDAVTEPRWSAQAPPRPGERVDRYRILEQLGAGGCGVVYRARDTKLDRDVAIKLLRSGIGAAETAVSKAEARLRLEARAMAQLSHPNVVPVYDVGEAGDQLFITEELVEGMTLHAWLREEHDLDEILDVFIQAGRGLAAAHAAGLLHRDFKPQNVMVGVDRVRVMDFGLARAIDGSHGPLSGPSYDDATQADDAEPLTRTGIVVGTPLYMPIEQITGGPIDERTDQFAFCVALYEAVYGQRPFRTANARAMIAERQAPLRAPPRDVHVPPRIREVIARGLRARPSDRWPTMDDLLDALRPPSSQARGRFVLAGGVLVAIAAALLVHRVVDGDTVDCGAAGAQLAPTWPGRADAIRIAFTSTDVPFAADAWQSTRAALDTWGDAWRQGHRHACESGHDGSISGADLDATMACLERHGQALQALVASLETADAIVVRNATRAVSQLPRAVECADAGTEGLAALPTDAAQREEAQRLRGELARAAAFRSAGRFESATEVLARAEEDARTLGFEAVALETDYERGILAEETGDYAAAADLLERVYFAAVAAKLDILTARAATWLAFVVGRKQERVDEGVKWIAHAKTVLARGGLPTADEVEIHNVDGLLLAARGEFSAAEAAFQLALTGLEETVGAEDVSAGALHNNLGSLYDRLGQPARARAEFTTALGIYQRALGSTHPEIGNAYRNLATTAASQGDFDAARQYAQQGLETTEAALGSEHPDLVGALEAIGIVTGETGQHGEARAYFERALTLAQELFPEDHPVRTRLHHNIAITYSRAGRQERALDHLQAALVLQRRAYGPQDEQLVVTLTALASVLLDLERYDAALPHAQEGRAILEAHHRGGHPRLARVIATIAEIRDQQGHPEGVELAEQAVAMLDSLGQSDNPNHADIAVTLGLILLRHDRAPEAVAVLEAALPRMEKAFHPQAESMAKLGLAKALWQTGGDRKRAVALATAAGSLARDHGLADLVEEATTWLASHAT